MVTKLLTTINDREILDGQIDTFVDQGGGADRYLIESSISGDVEIQDADGGVVVIPAGVNLESVRIAAGGTAVQFVVNGSTITFVSGAAGADYSFVLAGSNENLSAGRALTAQELAAEVGATLGGPAVTGGVVGSDGTIGGGVNPAAVVLTEGRDIESGNLFEAPRGFTPGGTDQVNTLDDDDVLTGTGTNPTLNFTFVDDADLGNVVITPTLNNIATVNVSVQGAGNKTLDLQDASGLDALNVSRINASTVFQAVNIAETVANFSINSSVNPAGVANFAHLTGVLAGAADATTLTLNSAIMRSVNIDNTVFQVGTGNVVNGPTQGYETVNIVSSGTANSIGGLGATLGTLGIFGAQTINITGDQDLRLGGIGNANGVVSGNLEANNFQAGLNGVTGFLTNVNASALTGALQYFIGGEISGQSSQGSGSPIQMTVTGGSGNDQFVLTNGAVLNGATTDTDTIIGGDGTDTLVVTNATVNAAATPNVRSVEALQIRTGHDALAAADTATVDADAFDSLASVFLRNEGQNAGATVAEAATINLVDLTAAQATAITVQHGTTGNNVLNTANAGAGTPGETQINVDLKAPGTNDTVAVTITNGLNTDVRSNFELNAVSTLIVPPNNQTANVENITITDSDTESNTVLLTQATTNAFVVGTGATGPTGHTGTITLSGGSAGTFFNLDATANAYRYDQTGAAADGGTVIPGTAGNRSDVGGGVAERLNAATIDASAMASNVIVRVSDNSADNLGAQRITMGSGNDTVIFDQIVNTAANYQKAGLTINDVVNGGAGTDIIAFDGNGTAVTIGASEWTNVSNFEIVRLIGNGAAANNAINATNSYNLTLTDAMFAANGVANGTGKRVTIVNDNDGNNDVVNNAVAGRDDFIGAVANNTTVFLNTGVEGGVTIDMRGLSANNAITYNGEEGLTRTPDRFIFSDANINGGAIIDGGRVYGAVGATTQAVSNLANTDVLEVRNGSVVSLGDLVGISNVGNLQFTNDTAVAQTNTLTLDTATIDRLVNDGRTAATGFIETLSVTALDNANVNGATTNLVMDASLANTANTQLSVLLGRGTDNVIATAGNDTITQIGNFLAGTYNQTVNQIGINTLANGIAPATQLVANDTINGGLGTDTLVTYGGINFAGATLTSIEAMLMNSNVTLTGVQGAALTAGTNTITASGNLAGHVLNFAAVNGNNQPATGQINLSNLRLDGGATELFYTIAAGNTTTGTAAAGVINATGYTFGTDGVDTVMLGAGALAGVTQYVGLNGNDNITGSGMADTIYGGEGNDTINGGVGNDQLIGGAGNDTLVAGEGMDTIVIGQGQDTVDLAEGAAVADTVQFSSAFAAGNANAAVITGFANGAGVDTFDIGFAVLNGATNIAGGIGATNTLSAVAPVLVADNGQADANGVIYLFGGAGDQLAAGTNITNAVANAVAALTSTADFSGANIATGDSLVLVMDDGTNSFVFHYVADATPATTTAADLELIAQINGIADAATFATGDFI